MFIKGRVAPALITDTPIGRKQRGNGPGAAFFPLLSIITYLVPPSYCSRKVVVVVVIILRYHERYIENRRYRIIGAEACRSGGGM